MNTLLGWFSSHPYFWTVVGTWLSNYGISAFMNALPAPGAESSAFYVFCFKFATGIFGQNPTRALNTTLETSPNFAGAMKLQQAAVSQQVANVLQDAKIAKP